MDSSTTELRVVTVLFADLAGFSTLAEQTDAESTRALLADYFATCRTIVERYGGTIEKFIGDAVMAVWGYPNAGEDTAERAVRAGLDLIEAVVHPLRVGITTGTVAVSPGSTDGLVAGDTVNLAARIQQNAITGEVWTDQATRDAAQNSIDFEPRGEQLVKGRTQPVTLHAARAVMGERGGRGRLDVLNVPLVGYRRELSAIKDALHATIEGERGRLVVVTGEAGTGKSRLGRELLNYADGVESGIRWHSSRASALDNATPYGALEAAVRGRLGVTEQNPDELVERLDANLREFVPELGRRAQIRLALSVLLGIGDKSVAQQDLFIAWTAWFAALASADDDTVVWVLDDAHFASELLLNFVELLVTTVGTRVLVVLFARPELLASRPGLVSVRGSSVIGLEGLNRAAMGELVATLIDDAPADLRENLVAGAGGLPLYAIEVVRGMIDRGEVVVTDGHRRLSGTGTALGAATPSLSGVVMSRLDLLDPYDRRFLQQASVLGQSFTVEQVAALVEVTTDVAAEGLARLAAKDLLRAANDTLSSEFGQHSFVQALVQQVAYDSLAKEERARLHLRAAELLSDAGADSGIVVEHVLLARSLDEAAPTGLDVTEWLEAAAVRAERTSSYAIALRNYELAMETTTDAARINAFHLEAANLAYMIGDNPLALRHAGLVHSDVPEQMLSAACITAVAYQVQGRRQEAIAILEQWPELPSGGVSHATGARWAAAQARVGYDEWGPDVSGRWAERSLHFAELANDPVLIHNAVNLLANASSARGLGRVATAIHLEGARLARENGLSFQLSISLNNVALQQAKSGQLAAAVATLAEAIETSIRFGGTAALIYPMAARIEYLVMLGRVDEAVELASVGDAIWSVPTPDTVQERSEFLQAAAWARWIAGRPVEPSVLDLLRAAPGDDVESLRTGSNAVAMFASVLDQDDRTSLARHALTVEFEVGGISDGLPTMWPRYADVHLDSGDYAGLRSMLELLPELGDDLDTRALSTQVRRVRASLDALDPSSRVSRPEVEVNLRTSIEELEGLGLEIDRCRTLVVLARLLESLGRASGASSARAEAASALRASGALGLLRHLGLE